MVRENRIRIMTAIAAYEKRHREELSGTDQWFRCDYIGVRMLKNGCRLTCGYLIGFAFYIVLHFEEMLDRLNSMHVLDLAENALIFYGISLGVYLILTYVVWSIRYYQAEKRRRTYGRLIDRLEAEYQREEKEVPSTGRRREGQNRSRGHGAGNP